MLYYSTVWNFGQIIEKPAEAGFLVGLITRSFLPCLCLKRLENIRCRLRLLVLLDLQSSPTVLSTLLLLTQSILCQAHHKNTSAITPIANANITDTPPKNPVRTQLALTRHKI